MIFSLHVFVHMQNIKVESGDMRSPMFGIYKELEFLQVCVLMLLKVMITTKFLMNT